MDTVTSVVVGALLGGILTVIGGLLATLLLGRIEQDREVRRQRERHATAVRIVVLELQSNALILSMHAAGVTNARTSTAGLDSVSIDFYSLLPEDLASDVGIAYIFTSRMPPQPAMAARAAERVEASLNALKTYGEDKLGLKFGPSEVRLRRTAEAFLKRAPEPQPVEDPKQ